MKPRRIQRKRTKGWRIADECKNPNGYVVVSRPSVYGNPFTLEKYSAADVKKFFCNWVERQLHHQPDWLEPLRGKDLVCWCPLDAEWCHADLLLELANRKKHKR